MKFTFDKNTLIKEIKIAQEIISTKNAFSILSNVLLTVQNNTLTIKATDIKVNFETQIPVQVEEEGSTTVFCDKLMGILSTAPDGEIEFYNKKNDESSETNVIIRPISKRSISTMRCISTEKYPDFPSADNLPYFEVSSKEFKHMISETIFAVSTDEQRYYMNGVYFEKKGDNLNLVATDGMRLSIATENLLAGVRDFEPVILPVKILNIILKNAPDEGNISIAVMDEMVFFKFGTYKFGSILIKGKFPEYTRVIPENQAHKFFIEKTDFVDCMRRVSQMIDTKAGRIYFTVSDGTLKISSSNVDLGSVDEEIPCMYAGDSYTFAITNKHIEEPLRVMDSEKICIEFTEEMKAVTMRPEPAQDYFHIIMPMQK